MEKYIEIINKELNEKLLYSYKELDGKHSIIFKRGGKLLKTFEVKEYDNIINFLDGFYMGISPTN